MLDRHAQDAAGFRRSAITGHLVHSLHAFVASADYSASERGTLKRRHTDFETSLCFYTFRTQVWFLIPSEPLAVTVGQPKYVDETMCITSMVQIHCYPEGMHLLCKRKIVKDNKSQLFGSSCSTDLRADVVEIPTDWKCVTAEC